MRIREKLGRIFGGPYETRDIRGLTVRSATEGSITFVREGDPDNVYYDLLLYTSEDFNRMAALNNSVYPSVAIPIPTRGEPLATPGEKLDVSVYHSGLVGMLSQRGVMSKMEIRKEMRDGKAIDTHYSIEDWSVNEVNVHRKNEETVLL